MENYNTGLSLLSNEELISFQGGLDFNLGDWVTDTIDNIHKYGKSLGRQIGEAIW